MIIAKLKKKLIAEWHVARNKHKLNLGILFMHSKLFHASVMKCG